MTFGRNELGSGPMRSFEKPHDMGRYIELRHLLQNQLWHRTHDQCLPPQYVIAEDRTMLSNRRAGTAFKHSRISLKSATLSAAFQTTSRFRPIEKALTRDIV